MNHLRTGIIDIEGLPVTPTAEADIRNDVEKILPKAWGEFRHLCVMAFAEMSLAKANKTTNIRKEIIEAEELIEKLQTTYCSLSPAAKMILPVSVQAQIEALQAIFSTAKTDTKELPNGKQMLHYRDTLAFGIAKLMKENGIEPHLIRDIDNEWDGDKSYAELFRDALRMLEKHDPLDLFSHLQRGLEIAKRNSP